MIKCSKEEKNILDGLCDVVLKAAGASVLNAVNKLQSLIVIEKGRKEEKKRKVPPIPLGKRRLPKPESEK